jgi:hypothetical protein
MVNAVALRQPRAHPGKMEPPRSSCPGLADPWKVSVGIHVRRFADAEADQAMVAIAGWWLFGSP